MTLVTFSDLLKMEQYTPIDVVKPWEMYSAQFVAMIYSYGILTFNGIKDESGKIITVPVGREYIPELEHICGIFENEEFGVQMSSGAYTLKGVKIFLQKGLDVIEETNLGYMHLGHRRFGT